jgi:hypothetical protein
LKYLIPSIQLSESICDLFRSKKSKDTILCPCCFSSNLTALDRYFLSQSVFGNNWEELEPAGLYVTLFCDDCLSKIKFEFLILSSPERRIAINYHILEEPSLKQKRKTIKTSIRYQVLKRDKHRCQSCGATAKDGAKLQIDHIKPVSKGGSNDLENLQVLCRDCNLGKGNKY